MKNPASIVVSLALFLIPSCIFAMASSKADTDTTWLKMQTIVLPDTTIIAAVTAEDDTRVTLITPTGEVYNPLKSAVRSMTFAYDFPMTSEPVRVQPPPHPFIYSRDWKVTLSGGSFFAGVGLDTLRGDSLILAGKSGPIAAPVRDLQGLYRDNGAHFWMGAGIGAAAGLATFLTMFIVAVNGPRCSNCGDGDHVVLMLGTPSFTLLGGIVGGIIGAFIPDRDAIDLSSMSREEKEIELERIISGDRR